MKDALRFFANSCERSKIARSACSRNSGMSAQVLICVQIERAVMIAALQVAGAARQITFVMLAAPFQSTVKLIRVYADSARV
jgi:hypothetical protein